VLDDLFDEENPEPIVVTITVTPSDVDGGIVEDGSLVVVKIDITIDDELITEIPAQLKNSRTKCLCVSLANFSEPW
jgi:hypothetical protein